MELHLQLQHIFYWLTAEQSYSWTPGNMTSRGRIDVMLCGFVLFCFLIHLSLYVCLCRSTAQRTVEAARCCRSVKTSNRSSLGSAGWRDRPKTSSMLCSTEKVTHTHTHCSSVMLLLIFTLPLVIDIWNILQCPEVYFQQVRKFG